MKEVSEREFFRSIAKTTKGTYSTNESHDDGVTLMTITHTLDAIEGNLLGMRVISVVLGKPTHKNYYWKA